MGHFLEGHGADSQHNLPESIGFYPNIFFEKSNSHSQRTAIPHTSHRYIKHYQTMMDSWCSHIKVPGALWRCQARLWMPSVCWPFWLCQHSYGKWPSWNSFILIYPLKMVVFHRYVHVYQRVTILLFCFFSDSAALADGPSLNQTIVIPKIWLIWLRISKRECCLMFILKGLQSTCLKALLDLVGLQAHAPCPAEGWECTTWSIKWGTYKSLNIIYQTIHTDCNMIKSCNAKKIKNIQLIRWLIQLLSIMNWSFEDILNEICKWTRHNWWIPIEELDHYKSNGESLW